MLAAPRPRPTQSFDPELESVREKVRATLRQLHSKANEAVAAAVAPAAPAAPAPESDTDSAFFRIAKRTRMALRAYTEDDLDEGAA